MSCLVVEKKGYGMEIRMEWSDHLHYIDWLSHVLLWEWNDLGRNNYNNFKNHESYYHTRNQVCF